MPQAVTNLRPQPHQLLLLAVCAAALYIIVPQFGDFRTSWQLVRHPDSIFTLAAAALTLATYGAAAGTYCLLAAKHLSFWRTLLVQLAATFVNRLVPAGLGALGVNYLYLRQAGHQAASATSIVSLNNFLGFMGHGLLFIGVLVLSPPSAFAALTQPLPSALGLLKIVAALAAIGIAAGLFWGWKRLRHFGAEFIKQVLAYRRRPGALAGALATSTLLTLCNVLCLVCCLSALDIHLSLVTVVVVFSFGVGTGAVTPTPGGLGGFEAGLAAGLVTYHVGSAEALAAALLYRLISYWLPLGLGVLAFIVCQRRRWLGKDTSEA